MPEIADRFEVVFLSAFGDAPDLPPNLQELFEQNVICLGLRMDGQYKSACTFENTTNILSTKLFTGNIGLFDSFLKNIILFFRVQSNKSQTIRFFSNDETELLIMKNLEIRFVDSHNNVVARKLTGPHLEENQSYYEYGNKILFLSFLLSLSFFLNSICLN